MARAVASARRNDRAAPACRLRRASGPAPIRDCRRDGHGFRPHLQPRRLCRRKLQRSAKPLVRAASGGTSASSRNNGSASSRDRLGLDQRMDEVDAPFLAFRQDRVSTLACRIHSSAREGSGADISFFDSAQTRSADSWSRPSFSRAQALSASASGRPRHTGKEAEEAQDAQKIFAVRVSASPMKRTVRLSSRPVRRPGRPPRHRRRVERVDGEVAAFGIAPPVAPEPHLGAAAIGLDVVAQRRHLIRPAGGNHGDRAVLDAGRHRLEAGGLGALGRFRRQRRRCDVDIRHRLASSALRTAPPATAPPRHPAKARQARAASVCSTASRPCRRSRRSRSRVEPLVERADDAGRGAPNETVAVRHGVVETLALQPDAAFALVVGRFIRKPSGTSKAASTSASSITSSKPGCTTPSTGTMR